MTTIPFGICVIVCRFLHLVNMRWYSDQLKCHILKYFMQYNERMVTNDTNNLQMAVKWGQVVFVNINFLRKFIMETEKTVSDFKKEISNIVLIFRSCHITYVFQSESTLYSSLNVKKLLARNRSENWSLSDCNWVRSLSHLVHKRTLNHLAILVSVRLWTKRLWVRIQLQSLKLHCSDVFIVAFERNYYLFTYMSYCIYEISLKFIDSWLKIFV